MERYLAGEAAVPQGLHDLYSVTRHGLNCKGTTNRPSHTVRLGRIGLFTPSLAVNCQATIIQSLRDKDVGTQSTAPSQRADTPTRPHADTPTRPHAATVPVPANVGPSSGMKISSERTGFLAGQKLNNKNFSSRNARKNGVGTAQKIAWHKGCLRGFASSD